jgi:hypothetical protein
MRGCVVRGNRDQRPSQQGNPTWEGAPALFACFIYPLLSFIIIYETSPASCFSSLTFKNRLYLLLRSSHRTFHFYILTIAFSLLF